MKGKIDIENAVLTVSVVIISFILDSVIFLYKSKFSNIFFEWTFLMILFLDVIFVVVLVDRNQVKNRSNLKEEIEDGYIRE